MSTRKLEPLEQSALRGHLATSDAGNDVGGLGPPNLNPLLLLYVLLNGHS